MNLDLLWVCWLVVTMAVVFCYFALGFGGYYVGSVVDVPRICVRLLKWLVCVFTSLTC